MRISLIYAINIVSEPLKLYGEGYYNLNDIKVQNHKNIVSTLMILLILKGNKSHRLIPES